MALKRTDPSSSELQRAVQNKYRLVSQCAEGHFPYPVGRPAALRLGYERSDLDALPAPVVDRFVGVGRPFAIHTPHRGDRVLDVGCGCGFDAQIAARMVGPEGSVAGIDLTSEMVDAARRGLEASGLRNVVFRVGSAEALPVPDGAFDLVISNGALNLVPDKKRAFLEIRRVLHPGGILAVADLLVVESIPDSMLADMDAWSS